MDQDHPPQPPPAPPRPRWRGWLRRAQWLLPALVLVAAELALRHFGHNQVIWYGAACEQVRAQDVQALFVGSSRVAAAIDVEAIADAVAATGRPRPTVLNLGFGYSTLPEHQLGLRDLYALGGAHLRGATVFVEMPSGLPAPDGWRHDIYHPEAPWNLLQVLRRDDLGALWGWPLPVSDKLGWSLQLCARDVLLLWRRETLRLTFLQNAERLLGRVLGPAAAVPAAGAPPAADLGTGGGVRVDDEGVQSARRAAERVHAAGLVATTAIDWDDSAALGIIRLVQGNGGTVVFFTMPQHSLFASLAGTPLRRADRDRFAALAARSGVRMIDPGMPTVDADFPDDWHLRRSLAAAYSQALVRAWLAPPTAAPGADGAR